MSDKRILEPFGQCYYMPGYERPRPAPYPLPGLVVTETKERLRIVYRGLAGLTVNKTSKTIEHVYTLPSERRKGHAKSLIVVARAILGTVKHSQYLTHDGQRLTK